MRPQARWFFVLIAFAGIALAALVPLQAQPGGKKGDKKGGGINETASQFADKVMAFNKAKNGKLTKEELTDTRLHGLFDRADTNKDGFVTREELEALHAREFVSGGGDGKKGKGPKDKGPKDKGPKDKGPKDKDPDGKKAKSSSEPPQANLGFLSLFPTSVRAANRQRLADLLMTAEFRSMTTVLRAPQPV